MVQPPLEILFVWVTVVCSCAYKWISRRGWNGISRGVQIVNFQPPLQSLYSGSYRCFLQQCQVYGFDQPVVTLEHCIDHGQFYSKVFLKSFHYGKLVSNTYRRSTNVFPSLGKNDLDSCCICFLHQMRLKERSDDLLRI